MKTGGIINMTGDSWDTRCSHGFPCGPDSVRGQFSGMVSRHCCVLFSRSTHEDVVPVCLHVSSMSAVCILLLRGEGLSVFSNRHSVWCVVRSAARQHNVGCFCGSEQHLLCLQLSVNFVCRCVFRGFVLYAGTPSEHFSSMCMCFVPSPAQNRTVELMTAGTHRRCCHEQDSTETR